ncbi:hypothetical protein ACFQ6B_38735 [Streptomyces wedmorensis]|uniref:4'-phosphopantetheinyl transferase n=1 Tax=Streptomyces wedmorensis TaxID=43759 RepID=A0ABW6J914_STRWE
MEIRRFRAAPEQVDAAERMADLPSPEERRRGAVFRRPADRDLQDAFLRCRVRKEAYLKGIGTSLGIDPDTVRVGLGPRHGDTESPEPEGWRLATVAVPPGYAAAVALRHRDTPVVAICGVSLTPLPTDRAV